MLRKHVSSPFHLLLVVGLLALASPGSAFSADLATRRLSEHLRERPQGPAGAAEDAAKKFAAGEMFRAPLLPIQCYQERAFRPAWVGDSGPLPTAYALMQRIRAADRHGLNPTMYHLSALEALLTDVSRDPVAATKAEVGRLGDLELLLTEAFFLYASHARRGQVSPKALDEVWFADHPESDVGLVQLLQEGLAGQQLAALLDALPPSHAAYDGLMRARAQYQEIAARGGWPQVPAGPKLRKGDHGARVQA